MYPIDWLFAEAEKYLMSQYWVYGYMEEKRFNRSMASHVYICQLDGKFKNWHIVFGDDGKLMDVYED